MILDDKVIITESNRRYLIIETVEYEKRKFIYLVNEKNELETLFAEITDNGNTLKTIVPEFLEGIILPLFIKKFEEGKK